MWIRAAMSGSPRLAQQDASRSDRALEVTAIALVTAFTIHGIDHLNRGLHFESALILVLGTVQSLLVGLAVVLVITRNRWAAAAAVVVGCLNATGFTVQHLLPEWFGPLSDSFIHAPPARHVTVWSWLFAVLDDVAAFAFAVAGGVELTRRKRSHATQFSRRGAAT
jgi:cyanate permease